MVPYLAIVSSEETGTTALTNYISAASTSDYDGGPLVITPTRIPKEEDLSLPLPKEKPRFERVMKTRNPDGRPIRYSTWKPVRMYDGRDNIGTRNFKKVN